MMLVPREQSKPTIAGREGWMYIIKCRIMREFVDFILTYSCSYFDIFNERANAYLGER